MPLNYVDVIDFNSWQLPNGLHVLHYHDKNTPLACVNVAYNVGARNENPNRTGFAHLFEHLMFSGSKHIANFDTHVQRVGGQNNAFTNNDYTNYYMTLPAANLETALWLESDRMMQLAFSEQALKVQQGVVIEEFKQRYLNQPYGDAMLHLRPLAYKVHPYQWPTIGKSIDHVAEAQLEDVVEFFNTFYHPANAVLCLAGNVDMDTAAELTQKWFGEIPSRNPAQRTWQSEPEQTEQRREQISRPVPHKALFAAFHCGNIQSEAGFNADFLARLISDGASARLYQVLVKERQLFTEVSLDSTSSLDPGLLIFHGMLNNKVSFTDAEQAFFEVIRTFEHAGPTQQEMEKVRNKASAAHAYAEANALQVAMQLCFHHLCGDANGFNTYTSRIKAREAHHLQEVTSAVFQESNSSILWYDTN